MNFAAFMDNATELSDEAFREKLKKALEILANSDIEILRECLVLGDFDFMMDMEADDSFGTEGMSL